jgi:hypothetical protein
MAEARFYPEVIDAPSPPDLATRVAELERMVETLAGLRREIPTCERRDPVALTSALHPGGMRSVRSAKRRRSGDGTLPMRFVLFDPSPSR